MKKIINLIFILLLQFYYSQFYIVNDKDGYVNIRKTESVNSKIIGKLKNGEIVHSYEDDNKSNWITVDFFINSKNDFKTGYIYKDRLLNLYDYENIPIIKNSDYVILKNNGIEIKITEKKFKKSKHSFLYHKQYKNAIIKIDNEEYYGTDGEIPEFQYAEILIKINGKTITLPSKALKNLFQPNLFSTSAHYDKKNDILYIDSLNSDGAGSYEVLWIIKNGKYSKRIIFSGC